MNDNLALAWKIKKEERFMGNNLLAFAEDAIQKNNHCIKICDEFPVVKLTCQPSSKIINVNVIVPNKVVECLFSDGTKTKSVCQEPDVFSLETAIGICVAKKVMGGSGAYNKAVKDGIKQYEAFQQEEKTAKEELARIEKKKAKRKAYMERRAQKRADAEKERQIEIQKEAYIRAMEYINGKDTAAKSK